MASGVKLRAKHGGVEIRRLANLSGRSRVLVGVLSGTGEHPNADHGQTVAEIAFWNEFGTSRIPPRPFLRRTLREQRYYKTEFVKILRGALDGRNKFVLLGVLGARAASDVQSTITRISDPPNALSTQLRKAAPSQVKVSVINNPLIDTGTMRASIKYEVVP